MAILLIDLGNSCLKWSQSVDSLPLTSTSVAYREQDLAGKLHAQWGTLIQPDRVFIASVAGDSARGTLLQWLQNQWSLEPEFLVSPAQGLGIRNAYREPARLGCDRWAAMVAAYHQAGTGICVVDCGTAVTLDVVTAEGQHRGGLILPGLAAMQTGLSRHTRLPQVDFASVPDALLGASTEEAIALGVTHAVAALIEQTMMLATQRYGEELACFLSGGDAGRITSHLIRPSHMVPDLVLQGLAMIASDT